MKKKFLSIFTFAIIGFSSLYADEGMWIPLLLEKYTITDMQSKGFKLNADDIYSINKACIKDAIVIFGRGCTGELVSDQGLLLTNHHCGNNQIQKHSSVEKDYLTNGFWAMSKADELPNPGLTVKFLVRIEDVTEKVLKGVNSSIPQMERKKIIREKIDSIEANAVIGTNYLSSVRSFYYGNEYYLFVYEEFKDIRLVGAPPSSIGNFGGDTDNWTWPRHTGDFSIFRIYADKNNNPAEYSPENVPYKPKKFLNISLKGVKENDFTWVLGYPGGTEEYLTSHAIKLISAVRNPHKIKIRDERLKIMNAYMQDNDTIRIKYSSKNYGISNSWKRWDGEIKGLNRLDAVNKKIKLENEFELWAQNKPEYKGLIDKFGKTYYEIETYALAHDYWQESIKGIEIVKFASEFEELILLSEKQFDSYMIAKEVNKLINSASSFYKDYEPRIDKEVFKVLLPMYFANVNEDFYPSIYSIIKSEYNNDFNQYIDIVLSETIFNKPEKLNAILKNYSKQNFMDLKNDPIYKLYSAFLDVYNSKVSIKYSLLQSTTDSLYSIYINGLREMQHQKVFYPDANFTMRVAYGNVKGYNPRDGVIYKYYTTIDGVMEKDNPLIYDYDVPEKLKEIYKQKDYGIYAIDGEVPVCFLATNHTTGGNSGSPVLDAYGNLIGINFDREWEGIASDMMFDPDLSRNISLDIRYVLFIIDKYAGANNLIEEMELIK